MEQGTSFDAVFVEHLDTGERMHITGTRSRLREDGGNLFAKMLAGGHESGLPRGPLSMAEQVFGSDAARDVRQLRASLVTTDWAYAMSDGVNKQLVRDYTSLHLDTWRAFTDVVSIENFKQQQRIRFGGYANIPTVAEGAPFLPVDSPADELSSYVPVKRGGTEDVTLEMILNDDLAAIRAIPRRMARAAAQTLHEFVYDFIRPSVNPTIYTGGLLYTAGQTNYYSGTETLATAGKISGIRSAMAKFPEMGTAKPLGIRPRFLVVPPDLAETAYGLVTPAFQMSNAVPGYIQQLGLLPVVVEYWTDVNDFVVVADKGDVVGLEIGFLKGQEMPELVIADNPRAGGMFTNDKLTWRIKHVYGGAVCDWRAFFGHICTT